MTFWLSFWKITYFPIFSGKICCFQTDLGEDFFFAPSNPSHPPYEFSGGNFLGSIYPDPLAQRYNRQPLGRCTLAQLRCKSPKRVTSAPLNCNIGLSTSIDDEVKGYHHRGCFVAGIFHVCFLFGRLFFSETGLGLENIEDHTKVS